MKRPSLFVVLVTLILLSCGPIRKESPSADPAPEVPAEAPRTENLPPVELTQALLFELLVAEVAGQRGALDEASRLYISAANSTRDPRVAERATRIALFARDKDRALAAARLWVDLDQQNAEARQVVILLLLDEGQYDATQEHLYQLAGLLDKPPLDEFMQIAALLERAQDKQAALRLMEAVAAKAGNTPEALIAYSSIALHAGDLPLSQRLVEQVLAQRPDWPEAAMHRARLLHMQKKTDEALDYLRQLAKRYPERREIQLGYARLLIDADRLEEAVDQFQALVAARPEDDEALFALGLLLLQAERADEAEGYMLKLVQSGKRTAEASYFLGQIAESKDRPAEAKDWYGKIQGGDYYFDSQIRLAALAAAEGDVPGALRQLEALQPSSREEAVRVYLVQAEILADARQLQPALQVYGTALKRFPGDADLLYARALLAERMDNLHQTEDDLRAILAIQPDHAQALNALGYTLTDRTDRYQEALGYITRAMELRPNDPYILDSMGWVQYKLGNHQEALRYLRQAMELRPDGEIAAHLGEVLWMTGERDQARAVWEQARQKHPDSEPLRDVMQRFVQ